MNGKYIIIPECFATNEANELRKNLIDLINEGERNFSIDFSNCSFIDTAGLGVLISIQNRCKKVNGSLKLCSINNPNVIKVIELTRLNKILKISNYN